MRTTPKALAVATSAAGVAAMLTVPWSAGADPACLDWRFAQDALFLNLDNGVRIGVPWLGGTNKVRTNPANASLLTSPDGGRWQGEIEPGGGTYQGDTIKFRINWTQGVGDQHPMSAFNGKIDANGVASGTTVNEKNVTNGWTAEGNFTCSARAAEPAPQPPPQPADQTPAANTVTVLKRSDVYDGPDGTGNRLGPETYSLAPGRKLTIAEPCRDNWCLLNIPDPEVPGGKGWVYSGEDYLQLP
ncbi:hypothetical protein DVS77_19570 [Mycolicibacterium moriokaense]|nr:hypothetical protein DVS77_19570 [Mycolicibacterium moriokaense]